MLARLSTGEGSLTFRRPAAGSLESGSSFSSQPPARDKGLRGKSASHPSRVGEFVVDGLRISMKEQIFGWGYWNLSAASTFREQSPV